MIRRKIPIATALVALLGVGAMLVPAAAQATAAPAWQLRLTPMSTNFAPGSTPTFEKRYPAYVLQATNVGSVPTAGPVTITATLPAGLTPVADGEFTYVVNFNGSENYPCDVSGQTVSCVDPDTLAPGQIVHGQISVSVDPSIAEGATVFAQATVSGGGAADPASASSTTTISSSPATFDPFAVSTSLGQADGSPATLAGSRPYRFDVAVDVPTYKPGPKNGPANLVTSGGGLKNLRLDFPPGLVIDPTATPVLCTDAELESNVCPDASTLGIATLTIPESTAAQEGSPLYNMVPPPGHPAELAFNVAGAGIVVHILGGVRAGGDYGLFGTASDIVSLANLGIAGSEIELWGDPSSPTHNALRGHCFYFFGTESCPVAPQSTPLLTMPSACSGSLAFDATASDWVSDPVVVRHPQIADSGGNPVGVTGCGSLGFSPTLKARPTTNVADSPSGLDVDLHIPQIEDPVTPAEAHLRKAVVTLPEGLVVNPSGANGLGVCSSSQIGLTSVPDATPVTFTPGGDDCPGASKIGTVEVVTPLLSRRDDEHRLLTDPETGAPLPEPLKGSVYLAKPFDNPFDSLLAIYIAVDDPVTGVVVKLAGQVVPDPQTGQLVTTVDDNPQLPFSDFKLSFFPGANAPLRTPSTCGSYSTTSEMTPWSGTAPVHPHDDYSIDASPSGGNCPGSSAAQPNSPSFDAGAASPVAGAYSPFVIHLRRNDGSQEFSAVTVTPPPGLTAKLAGIPSCPDGALAAAAGRPGNAEKASPSCPADSRIGTVTVGAGAGPAPYYAKGTAYLTGPYRGAPLGMAIVTPATAGPFDLGTVVTRVALHVDPASAQITATADPIPRILQGIPLDVRSVDVAIDRPGFSRTGTSCDPLAVSGLLVSSLGQGANLHSRFQLGGCSALGFRPKLAIKLKGGTKRNKNPALRAVLTYPKGNYANIASAQVTLPHSEFLDQSHIGTVCTRVQFAVKACPAASIYGRASAVTPLLDQPLSGPVYLRSSSNPLPDLVADLNGRIEVTLAGRVDTGKGGGIRNTFEMVPDAPVSKFVLSMRGGEKGLLVNSENLCSPKAKTHATVDLTAQNGKVYDTTPRVANSCRKKTRGHRKHRAHR
jgi:hypothetical protein